MKTKNKWYVSIIMSCLIVGCATSYTEIESNLNKGPLDSIVFAAYPDFLDEDPANVFNDPLGRDRNKYIRRLLLIGSNEAVRTIDIVPNSEPDMNFSPDGKNLIASSLDEIHVISANDQRNIKLNDPTPIMRHVSIDDSGKFYAFGHLGSDGSGKGFELSMVSGDSSKVRQGKKVLDGKIIRCGESIRLFTHDINRKDPADFHQLEYLYSSDDNDFSKVNRDISPFFMG